MPWFTVIVPSGAPLMYLEAESADATPTAFVPADGHDRGLVEDARELTERFPGIDCNTICGRLVPAQLGGARLVAGRND